MPPILALSICFAFIFFLLKLDYKKSAGTSRANWIPLIALLILGSRTVASWLNAGSPSLYLGNAEDGNPIDRNIQLILLALGIIILVRRKLNYSNVARDNIWIFLFIIYCFISSAWSDFPFITLKRTIRLLNLPIFTLVVLSDPFPTKALSSLFRKCTYILIPLSLILIKYYPIYGRSYSRWTGMAYYGGVSDNKNGLGALCLVSGIILAWDLISNWQNEQKFFKSITNWVNISLLGLTIYLLKISDSSTALACMIIGTGVLFGMLMPVVRRQTSIIGVCIISGGFLYVFFQQIFDINQIIISALGRNSSLTDRVPIWNACLSLHTNPLVGTGYEAFWLGFRKQFMWDQGYTIMQAHSGYVETYLNLGFIGIAFFLILIIATYRNIVKRLPGDFGYGQLRLAILAIFMFYNITEGTFPRADFLTFFLFLIAIPPPTFQFYSIQPEYVEHESNSPDFVSTSGTHAV
jgi:O-antigen ligase